MIGGSPISSRLRWMVAGLAALFMVWPSKAAAEEPGAEEALPVPLARLRARRWVPLLICIAAVAALLLWGVYAPSPAVAAGWLIGCLFWLSIAVGALVLIAVHALTGGRWGVTAWPGLAPAAATVPVFLLLGLPIAFVLHVLFPWVDSPAGADVASAYLNPQGWWLRAGIAVLGWSLLTFLLLRRNRPHRLAAGIGLCFHAAVMTLIGLDWVLSLDSRFYSTDFAATWAVIQILSALAWVAVLRVVPSGGPGRVGDIGGLMIATALGALYLGYSQYLVIWYGDLPERVKWYIDRQDGAWYWIDFVAILLVAVVPFFLLMRQAWRNSTPVVAMAGCSVLAGAFLHFVWLLAPPFGGLAALAAVLAVIAIGAFWITVAYTLVAPWQEASHAK